MNLYRQMRIILIYDLPTNEKIEQKIYNKFHNDIKKIGFYMLQYSVYVKIIQYDSNFNQIYNKLATIIPDIGNIILFKITEKQFSELIYLRGEKNKYETIVGNNELVVFRSDTN